jgi:hypothetical protein
VRNEGRAASGDHHDVQAWESTFGILRKLHAGRLSTKLYVGHERLEFRAVRNKNGSLITRADRQLD